MAMGGGQERDSALLGAVRCACCAMGSGWIYRAVVPLIQRDMALAVGAVTDSRCRRADRLMLVDIAGNTVSVVAARSDVDDTDRSGTGTGRSDHGALLEICDEHECAGDADRAT